MEKGDQHKAKITIAGREYPLNLNKEELSYLRELETELNTEITNYSKKFENIGVQDCISLVLIQKAFHLRNVITSTKNETVQTIFKEIETALES